MVAPLIESLRRHAVAAPQAEALIHGEDRVSYGELWRRVQGLGAYLRARGLGEGDRVALLLPNRPDYVIAYYGAWAAGTAVVALNTAARAGELLGCLEHSGARLLIADAGHPALDAIRRRWEGQVLAVPVAGGDGADWQAAQQAAPERLARPADNQLAALMYTSGTTGRPKGVMLSHGNLASNTAAIQEYLRLSAEDKALAVLPLHYAYGNSVLHTHIAAGASLLLESSLVYPREVLRRMAAERVTGLPGVATTFALLLNRAGLRDYDLHTLRYLTQAGGPMAPRDIRRMREALPQAEFFVMYGQTEATARLSYLPPEWLDRKPGSVGRPVAGVALQVRGDDGQPLPPGQSGEVWARGPNIMLGYWRDPEATRQVRRGDWLRTGDIGRMDADGFLYLEGRASDIIKTGAHRVSPHEIEEVIAELEGVDEVAVAGADDPLMGQVVHARVVLQPDADLPAKRIRAYCRDRLASYKIPKHIEFSAELPKTASGKVLRRKREGRS